MIFPSWLEKTHSDERLKLETSVFESFKVYSFIDLVVDNLLQCFTLPPTKHTVSFENNSPIVRKNKSRNSLNFHTIPLAFFQMIFGVCLHGCESVVNAQEIRLFLDYSSLFFFQNFIFL